VSSENKLDLLKLRAATYEPIDWIARIRTSSNALAWLPVFINLADRLEYVVWYGEWTRPENIAGFEKFEAVKPMPNKNKKLFNPHTREAVDTGLLPDEFETVRKDWSTLVQ
jgi:hypothetical protein